jgi:hypothetical protein
MYNMGYMKHALLRISVLLSVLALLVTFDMVSAASASKTFGGKIINTKATEIQSMENSNYKCAVPGTTITIKSNLNSSPTTYLIPSSVKSKTRSYPKAGQQILGLYSQSKTTITCKYQGYPPSQSTVQLTPITMYGTSKQ